MAEDGADLLVERVRSDPRREDRSECDEHEDRRSDHGRRPVAERVDHEAATALTALGRRLDLEGDLAHSVILGSSSK